ncbi:MAG: YciI family protein [Actinomycetota bacterium]|nr:YciI family protein [Actinomycetota bacterium]
MPQYLLAVHGSEESPYMDDEQMQKAFAAVDALNTELMSSGAWVFAGGLMPASTAQVVNSKDGVLQRTDGPYLDSKEHIGGFWVIEVADEATALRLAEQCSVACMNPVEVRPFQPEPEA